MKINYIYAIYFKKRIKQFSEKLPLMQANLQYKPY